MMNKPLALAALLAASCGAQAADDADLAAIRSQIDEMKKTYEQRITALEKAGRSRSEDCRAGGGSACVSRDRVHRRGTGSNAGG